MKSLTLVLLPWMAGLLLLGDDAKPPAGDSPPAVDASQARIEEILTRLEKRSDGLEDIRCEVIFVEDPDPPAIRALVDERIGATDKTGRSFLSDHLGWLSFDGSKRAALDDCCPFLLRYVYVQKV